MTLNKRRNNVKTLIEKGHIQAFREILEYYQITPLVKYLKSSHQRLTKYFNNVSLFRFGEVRKIAEYFEVEERIMIELIYNQIVEDSKKNKTGSIEKKVVKKKKGKNQIE
jgi:hypothetical protein